MLVDQTDAGSSEERAASKRAAAQTEASAALDEWMAVSETAGRSLSSANSSEFLAAKAQWQSDYDFLSCASMNAFAAKSGERLAEAICEKLAVGGRPASAIFSRRAMQAACSALSEPCANALAELNQSSVPPMVDAFIARFGQICEAAGLGKMENEAASCFEKMLAPSAAIFKFQREEVHACLHPGIIGSLTHRFDKQSPWIPADGSFPVSAPRLLNFDMAPAGPSDLGAAASGVAMAPWSPAPHAKRLLARCSLVFCDNPGVLAAYPRGFFDGNILCLPRDSAGAFIGQKDSVLKFVNHLEKIATELGTAESQVPLASPAQSIAALLNSMAAESARRLWEQPARLSIAKGISLAALCSANASRALGRDLSMAFPSAGPLDGAIALAFGSYAEDFAGSLTGNGFSNSDAAALFMVAAGQGNCRALEELVASNGVEALSGTAAGALCLASGSSDRRAAFDCSLLLAPMAGDLNKASLLGASPLAWSASSDYGLDNCARWLAGYSESSLERNLLDSAAKGSRNEEQGDHPQPTQVGSGTRQSFRL